MAWYVLKRIAPIVPILLASSLLVFFMIRLAPGDPVTSLVGTQKLSDESRQVLMSKFHLDKPLFEQYVIWLTGLLHGEFPLSFKYQQSVDSLLFARLPMTLLLVVLSFAFAIIFSLLLGIICAVNKNTVIDRIISTFLVLCASTPSFLLGIILILVFSLTLKWFPSYGLGNSLVEDLRYLTLPAIALGSGMLALTGRITRSRMINELRSNYARTETAKGTPKRRVVFAHCLKNAIIPVLTISGMQVGGMVVGAVMVERVFALGGVGELLVEGIYQMDYPMVQTIVVLMIALFLLINLVVDIVYGLIDPRIRLGAGSSQ
jgi:peptide/nickel transport system permease protein